MGLICDCLIFAGCYLEVSVTMWCKMQHVLLLLWKPVLKSEKKKDYKVYVIFLIKKRRKAILCFYFLSFLYNVLFWILFIWFLRVWVGFCLGVLDVRWLWDFVIFQLYIIYIFLLVSCLSFLRHLSLSKCKCFICEIGKKTLWSFLW